MKISKTKLRQIIKEELARVCESSQSLIDQWVDTPNGLAKVIEDDGGQSVRVVHPDSNETAWYDLVDIATDQYGDMEDWMQSSYDPMSDTGSYDYPNPNTRKLDEEDVNGEDIDLDDWSDDQSSKTWQAMGGTFDRVKKSAEAFSDEPDNYAAKLHKRETGKWPGAE